MVHVLMQMLITIALALYHADGDGVCDEFEVDGEMQL